MKQIFLCAAAFCMLTLLFLGSCNKNIITPKGGATVSTISTGGYGFRYITVDKSGNIYGLRNGSPADTIYKITANGKTLFYVPPRTISADTVLTQVMDALTTDSSGNVYTALYTGTKSIPSIIKISPSGTASVVYTNLSVLPSDGLDISVTKIAFDGLGNFYYGSYNGLYKISTNGTTTQMAASAFAFTPDSHGNLYSVSDKTTSTIQKISATGTTTNITLSTNVLDMGADVFGNIYISATTGLSSAGTVSYIQKLKQNDSVSTIMSSPYDGEADGPVSSARIIPAYSPVTDAKGNLYFLGIADIRKITF